jgi:trigger factor
MEIKTNKIDAVKQEVEFEVPYEELTPHFEKAYEKYRKKLSVPGFRKGKVPVSMLKKMYKEVIEQGSMEDVSNELFRDYLKENKVPILGEGSLLDMDYEPDGIFKFKVQYEIKPEFELKQYKELELTKTTYPVTDTSLDDEVKYLRSKNCTYEETDKITDDEFVITLDVQKLDDTNFPIIGESEKGVKFYLNDHHLNKELKEQLKTFEKGEEKVLTLTPKEGEKQEKYKAKAEKIEKIILPELNKEFFDKFYKDEAKDENEFRELVRKDLEKIYSDMSNQELRNTIVNELIKINEIPVPEVLVNNILDSYIEDIKHQSPKRELPADFNEEEYRKTRRVDAILQVKWLLIREKLIDLEKIEITEADLQPLIEADAKKYNLPVDKIKSIYEKNEDIKYKLMDNKLLDFLIQNSKIKEVVKEEEQKLTE